MTDKDINKLAEEAYPEGSHGWNWSEQGAFIKGFKKAQEMQTGMRWIKSEINGKFPTERGWYHFRRPNDNPFTMHINPVSIDKEYWTSEGWEWLNESAQGMLFIESNQDELWKEVEELLNTRWTYAKAKKELKEKFIIQRKQQSLTTQSEPK